MNSIRDVYEDLAYQGELAVAELLRARGHQVEHIGSNSPHDIVVNGSTTVEVKTALPSPRAGGRRDRWQFNLTKNDGQHAPMSEDLLILRCQQERNGNGACPVTGRHGETIHHYVIPGRLLDRNLTKVDITGTPDGYNGRYALFLEAWHLADAVIALRDKSGYQIPLSAAEEVPWPS